MDIRTAKAKDVMNPHVVTVSSNLLLPELAQILDDKGISGAAVVNRHNDLIGVVSKSDIVHHQRDGEHPDRFAYYRDASPNPLPRGYHIEVPDRTAVGEIMTPAIIQAKETTPVGQLARVMRTKHIHRIFITDGKKLRGVVTTMDILKLIEAKPKKPRAGHGGKTAKR